MSTGAGNAWISVSGTVNLRKRLPHVFALGAAY